MNYLCKFLFYTLIALSAVNISLAAQDAKITKALSMMDKGDYFNALPLLDEYLIKNPNNGIALYNAALCELYTGRADIALQQLQRFAKHNTPDEDVYNLIGLCQEKIGNRDSAIYYFAKCIDEDAKYYEAYFNRGRCYLQASNANAAMADFRIAKKDPAINPELYYTTAKLFFARNLMDSAIRDLKKIEKYIEKNVDALQLFADCYYRDFNYQDAARFYSKVLKVDSTYIYALNNRALCYDELGDEEKAAADRETISNLQKIKGVDPASIPMRTLVSKDSLFTLEIPQAWKTFARSNDSLEEVIFFDATYPNTSDEKGERYVYDFGGRILVQRYFWKPSDPANALVERENRFAQYQNEYRQSMMKNVAGYSEIMRKRFNPNDDIARDLVKFHWDDTTNNKQYYQVDYNIITTDGMFITLCLWCPYDQMFSNERLLDYLQESLLFKGKDGK